MYTCRCTHARYAHHMHAQGVQSARGKLLLQTRLPSDCSSALRSALLWRHCDERKNCQAILPDGPSTAHALMAHASMHVRAFSVVKDMFFLTCIPRVSVWKNVIHRVICFSFLFFIFCFSFLLFFFAFLTHGGRRGEKAKKLSTSKITLMSRSSGKLHTTCSELTKRITR